MPIYEYYCNACGHRFDELQKVDAPILHKCPKCKKLKLQKLISNTSFQLKGSGWYVTDFKGKKSVDAVAPVSKPKPSEKKAETKSD